MQWVYRFVLTWVSLCLGAAIYWSEARLRPSVSTRLEVVVVMCGLAFLSALLAFVITAFISDRFGILRINTGAFLAVSVPLGAAVMAFVGWILTSFMLVT